MTDRRKEDVVHEADKRWVRAPGTDIPGGRDEAVENSAGDGVKRGAVDGVTVYWLPGERDRVSAELVFGVGMADESFLSTGITHLVEHLAMRSFSDVHYSCNASVGARLTTFVVQGSLSTVATHLEQVCRALSRLDVDPLDRERGVLIAEEDEHAPPVSTWLPGFTWFGHRGVGLIGNTALAPRLAEPNDVLAWSRRWFHAGNAVLTVDGSPPAELHLPLLPGERPSRVFPAPLQLVTPARISGPDGFLASFVARDSAASSVAVAVLMRRLTNRLRHEQGLVYHVGRSDTWFDAERILIGVSADIPRDKVGPALATVRATLVDLDRGGVTEQEVRHEQAVHAEEAQDPEIAKYRLSDRAACDLLNERPAVGFRRAEFAALDAAAVSRAFAEIAPTLILAVGPDDPDPWLPELASPVEPPVRGRQYARALFGSDAPRGSVLVVGDEGLSVRPGPSGTPWITVRYRDVAGLRLTQTGNRDIAILTSEQGEEMPVDAGDWRGASTLLADVLRAVPPALHYRIQDRD